MDAGLRLDRPTRLWLVWIDHKTRDADLQIPSRVLLQSSRGREPARRGARARLRALDGRWANGTRKVGAAERRGICRVLTHRPPRPTWTLELLARVIEQELGLRLSVGDPGDRGVLAGARARCA